MARRARFSDFDGVITEEMLSDRQRAILDFIREHVYAKGYPPAVREIGKAVGLSSSASVHTHLHKLEEYGFLQRDPAKPRYRIDPRQQLAAENGRSCSFGWQSHCRATYSGS